ncbi:MAG: TIGR00730 family Rossman fold protein [Rhodospirillaceae bacterium]|nr:TIGR00730 family Rossman fold protein [Rhodospirillaceae bacterium]
MAEINSLCVFCGSSNSGPAAHRTAATRFGRLLAHSGIHLIFGGGRVGLMGVVADAALAAGGHVTGVIPKFLEDIEVGHPGVTRLLVVDSMHTRKRKMFDMSDAFVILPGGLGTLDELFEVLTWRYLGLHAKPIVIADFDGYWQPLLSQVASQIQNGYTAKEAQKMFSVVDRVEDILPAIESARVPPAAPASERL